MRFLSMESSPYSKPPWILCSNYFYVQTRVQLLKHGICDQTDL